MGNGFMIKSILYYCSCSSFLLTFICFTKYFLMPTALVPTVLLCMLSSISQKQQNTLFSNSLIYDGQIIKPPNQKDQKHNRKTYEQDYCWPAETQNFLNWLHKPQLFALLDFFSKHIREIPADFLHSELMASSHPHSACLIYVPVGSVFPVDREFPGEQRLSSLLHTILYSVNVLGFLLYTSM